MLTKSCTFPWWWCHDNIFYPPHLNCVNILLSLVFLWAYSSCCNEIFAIWHTYVHGFDLNLTKILFDLSLTVIHLVQLHCYLPFLCKIIPKLSCSRFVCHEFHCIPITFVFTAVAVSQKSYEEKYLHLHIDLCGKINSGLNFIGKRRLYCSALFSCPPRLKFRMRR